MDAELVSDAIQHYLIQSNQCNTQNILFLLDFFTEKKSAIFSKEGISLQVIREFT